MLMEVCGTQENFMTSAYTNGWGINNGRNIFIPFLCF